MVWLWVCFLALVFVLLALDLGVFHRKDHFISIKEAFGWTALWITVAMVFNAGLYWMYEHHLFGVGQVIGHEMDGKSAALQFLTGFIVEKSLSLDNIFVIAMIFTYFAIPPVYQHRVLFWGILGALFMRGVMIAGGLALIERFNWMIYVFGVALLFTAVKMMITREDTLEPDKNPVLRLFRKFYPVSSTYDGHRFFTVQNARRAMTPLLPALIVVETTDVMFAVDSIPAVIAVTRDPFIVYTSNVFAILGLRSLYFALAAVMDRFRYLKQSLVFLLAYIGVKMLLSHHYPIPTAVSLCVIAGILAVGVIASVIGARRDAHALHRPPLTPEQEKEIREELGE